MIGDILIDGIIDESLDIYVGYRRTALAMVSARHQNVLIEAYFSNLPELLTGGSKQRFVDWGNRFDELLH